MQVTFLFTSSLGEMSNAKTFWLPLVLSHNNVFLLQRKQNWCISALFKLVNALVQANMKSFHFLSAKQAYTCLKLTTHKREMMLAIDSTVVL